MNKDVENRIFQEPKERESFESEWNHSEVFNLSGGVVEVRELVPEIQKTNIPIVLIPSWRNNEIENKNTAQSLNKEGRRVVSASSPSDFDYRKESFSMEEMDSIPDSVLRKVAGMISYLDAKGIQKNDAIGVSEGCLIVLLIAALYPEYFRNIVLVFPNGMTSNEALRELNTSFSPELVRSYIDDVRNKIITRPMLHSVRKADTLTKQDHICTFREVLALSDVEIGNIVRTLNERGIGVSVISDTDETLITSFGLKNNHTYLKNDNFAVVTESLLTEMGNKTTENKYIV